MIGVRSAVYYPSSSGCSRAGQKAFKRSEHISRQMLPYQAVLLYDLMAQYNEPGNVILEIGTRAGFSASMIALAAPEASIITLEPEKLRVKQARSNLEHLPNIWVVKELSWNYLNFYVGEPISAIYVDGDHKRVAKDIPWFYKLKVEGLMLFHDYTMKSSPPVVREVDALAALVGRPLDIRLIDSNGVGMAGLYRREGD